MFYWSFTSLVHFWPHTIFYSGYALADITGGLKKF